MFGGTYATELSIFCIFKQTESSKWSILEHITVQELGVHTNDGRACNRVYYLLVPKHYTMYIYTYMYASVYLNSWFKHLDWLPLRIISPQTTRLHHYFNDGVSLLPQADLSSMGSIRPGDKINTAACQVRASMRSAVDFEMHLLTSELRLFMWCIISQYT